MRRVVKRYAITLIVAAWVLIGPVIAGLTQSLPLAIVLAAIPFFLLTELWTVLLPDRYSSWALVPSPPAPRLDRLTTPGWLVGGCLVTLVVFLLNYAVVARTRSRADA